MSEMSFEDMLNESFKTIRTGEVVTGKVIDVKPESILLNIGYKSDGIVNRADYSADSTLDLTTVVKVGDELEAKVRKINDGEGLVVLSHRDILTEKNNQKVQEAFDNKEVLTGKVDKAVNGGLSVIYDGVRVFVPASLVSDTFERDLTKYVGQDIEFVITEFNPQKHRIIGDRKQLIVARKAAARKALLESIHEGDVIDGTVKNVTDFGAFVDLGGADGLLHISEMGWGRTDSPKKTFHTGDEIRVMIKGISEEGKIALTRKFPDENPWVIALTKYAVGNVVEGKVARLADFGAFINLEQGIDALLHVSQISTERVEKPSDVLKVGDVIKAKVTDLDAEAKKISLSIKALLVEKAPKRETKEEDLEVADAYIDTSDEEEEAPAEE
ncbi:MAG: 30S ribosomal protein S1 [Lachnospiraceae bacterium]|nr:30S ribosomal protein S1 [Lachnospiraceae bacterium]MBQ2040759.1 30S ribosomal protein S1 [Lachnospiraceae bacterium]